MMATDERAPSPGAGRPGAHPGALIGVQTALVASGGVLVSRASVYGPPILAVAISIFVFMICAAILAVGVLGCLVVEWQRDRDRKDFDNRLLTLLQEPEHVLALGRLTHPSTADVQISNDAFETVRASPRCPDPSSSGNRCAKAKP
jgi:hypothetical protein